MDEKKEFALKLLIGGAVVLILVGAGGVSYGMPEFKHLIDAGVWGWLLAVGLALWWAV